MTISISALCASEDGKPSGAIVAASDKMVTLGNLIQFEHDARKIFPITDKTMVLIAGDVLRGTELAQHVALSTPHDGVMDVERIATIASNLYVEHRRRQMENDILIPRGINFDQYYGGEKAIQREVLMNIDTQLFHYNYNVEMLVCGVDDKGAFLSSVVNPGSTVSNFQAIGFASIGAGATYATQSMISLRHTSSRQIKDALFSVYVSKRRAEEAPGVGRKTDLVLITDKGHVHFAETIMADLEELYQNFQRAVTRNFEAEIAKLDW